MLLYDLPGSIGQETVVITPENPTGERGAACMRDPADPSLPHGAAARRLGVGWKVHPFLRIGPGETTVLADLRGSGEIRHIWLGTNALRYSEQVLRMYWDGEEEPSVECPLGAFFAMGFDNYRHEVTSSMVSVAPERGMSCYWPMPFRDGARITLTNEGESAVGILACEIALVRREIGRETGRFHAQYRRAWTDERHPEHVILDGVRGRGAYVGTYLAWMPTSTGWWGEGEVKFFLDEDREFPSIAYTGTEDYFGGAWNFGANGECSGGGTRTEKAFCGLYSGLPLAVPGDGNGCRRYGLYRWHVPDPVGFREELRATVQALAWYPDGTYRSAHDEIASVAYWYQSEPHAAFPALPPREKRWDR